MGVTREIRYQHAMNRAFADFFLKLPWEMLKENHETSHHNLADTFMHMVNMEDWYVHYILPGREWDGPAYDGFTSAQAMRERVLAVEKKTGAYLATLAPQDLASKRRIRFSPDEPGEDVMLEDFLRESAMEVTHHRGELLAILWREDIEPPSVSYLEWARANPA